jgi:hypothetical protein
MTAVQTGAPIRSLNFIIHIGAMESVAVLQRALPWFEFCQYFVGVDELKSNI